MKKIVLSALVISGFGANLFAQTLVSTQVEKKNIVLEEFTGIHCGYCPDGHKIAQEIKDANPGRAVLINIHTGGYAVPSGSEKDFRTAFGTALANQSGLTGYPAGTVNRHIFSGLSTTAMSRSNWAAAANIIKQENSPVNVGFTSTYNSSTRQLTINVEAYYTSSSAQSTNKIHVALLQNGIEENQSGGSTYNPGQINPSTGKYVHLHALRHLITGQWGQTISNTTSGSLYSNSFSYTLPTDIAGIPLIPEDCELAVFVSEGNQEIYTGVVGPLGGRSQVPTTNNAQMAVSTNSFTIPTFTSPNASFDFELTSNQPSGWSSSYTVNGSSYSSNQTIATNGNTNIQIIVNPGATKAFVEYVLTVKYAGTDDVLLQQKMYVNKGITDLVVNGSGGEGSSGAGVAEDFESLFTDGLAYAGNTAYDVTSSEGLIAAEADGALQSVNNIYYNVAWTFPPLNDEEANSLMSAMTGYKNLFICGQDLGWAIMDGSSGYGTPTTQNFVTNYLKANWSSDGTSANNQLTSVSSDGIFNGISSSSVVAPGSYGTNLYPDEISATAGASTIFNYNGNASKGAGVRYENSNYKSVYLGIGLENIGSALVKNEIVKRAHDWFYGLASVEENNIDDFTLYPNPANNEITVSGLTNQYTLKIQDAAGKLIYTENINSNTKNIDLTNFDNGIYSISLESETAILTKKFVKQ